MTILIAADSSDRPVIKALMQPYLAELSGYTERLESDLGKFHYPYLDFYWREPDRFPYLIQRNSETAGFVLVRRDRNPANGQDVMELSEIYIIPEYRRQQLAQRAALEAWHCFPGPWQLAVLKNNQPALQFWRDSISLVDTQALEEPPSGHTNDQYLFRFSVSPLASPDS